MNSYGISCGSVENHASASQNSHLARGQISNGEHHRRHRRQRSDLHADDYKPLIIGQHNGSAVRLSDVADVIDSVQDVRTAGYMDGKPSVTMIIFRQPGANIIETVDRIKASIPALKAIHPAGIEITNVFDRTITIRAV